MKRKTIVWLSILLVLLIVIGWLLFYNWNSITAVMDAVRYSEEELQASMQQNKLELQKFLEEAENISVRDLTEEEAQALNKGEITEEEAVSLLTGGNTPEPEIPIEQVQTPEADNQTSAAEVPKVTQQPSVSVATPDPTPAPTQDPSEKKISEAIARLYVQKSTYLNKLDAIEAAARQEFIANYGKSGKEGEKAGKKQMMTTYLPKVSAWEMECDTVVYGIIDEIRAELKKSGKDESIADKMKKAYLDEKKSKKAYFMNRYMD